jgi:hypothetical protein
MCKVQKGGSMGLTKKSSKRDVRRAWIEALLSGKYKKADGYLGTYDEKTGKGSFCALGVLCDLAVKAKVIPEPIKEEKIGREKWSLAFGKEEAGGDLPDEVREWAGITNRFGSMTLKDGTETCIPSLNDSGDKRGKSLKTIGNIIKTCPEGLFTEEK